MIYLIGDLQGCCDAFERLLAEIGFSPSRDQLYLLGDLVNRGPASLRTLQQIARFDGAARTVLGNHDLHLLAVASGARRPGRHDTLDGILDDPQREHWLHWLRAQSMAIHAHGWLMVHAGVLPQWSLDDTLTLAAEVEALLRGPDLAPFLHTMYANEPARWQPTLRGDDRLRLIINALTRLRFCDADGTMDFAVKEAASAAPPGLMPWFDVPGRRTAGVPIAFGHWSTLGPLQRPDLLALDTGCVWGGRLTAAKLSQDAPGEVALLSVTCEQAQVPG
jgi:bis(5'-nucleosyl)-tetraphosphatase (symmetrical)